jgi:rRNA maturation endonuclease Nob1
VKTCNYLDFLYSFNPKEEKIQDPKIIIEEEMKKCPRCAEQVKKEAQVCRYCGYEFHSKTKI